MKTRVNQSFIQHVTDVRGFWSHKNKFCDFLQIYNKNEFIFIIFSLQDMKFSRSFIYTIFKRKCVVNYK